VKFNHPERVGQVCEYDDLEYKGGTPTDIDALFEFRNKAYVIIELKSFTTKVPKGQRLCLERMANDFQKAGKKVMVIVGEHYEDPDKSIIVKNCSVREIYYNGSWYRGHGERLKDRMMSFLQYADGGANDYRRQMH
jgi:hypothetical protein